MLAGPYATMLLADLGAEVIKLEPPGGDISRTVSDTYFASLNRGKRSVCLDLHTEAGQARLGELAAGAHALLANLKPSAIRRLGLTYAALRRWNERIVCVALTGFGLDGGDDPAFDYVIQAATGVAALTGDPAGPPALPGYSAADNSAGLTAALGLLAQITSGRGGQVEVSMRDVMLSQLNYHAAAYLNHGTVPQRRPFGAHSHYVPAQLFPTAAGYLALFITHDGFWRSFAAEAGIDGFTAVAERVARRAEVLAVVTAALATDTARGWEARLRLRGVPAAAVRTLPEALAAAPGAIVTVPSGEEAGQAGFRLVGSPVRVAGDQPGYGPPPRLGEFGAGEHGPGEFGTGEHGPGEFGTGEHGPGEFGTGEHGPGEYGAGEHGPGEYGAGEHGPGEFGPGEHGPGEHGPGELGPAGPGPGGRRGAGGRPVTPRRTGRLR
jgi:CoA:oxalate CoA-transferase